MDSQEVAVKKYEAINKANRTMLGAVALASVVVSASIVGVGYFWRDITFKYKVIEEQNKSIKAIESSEKNIEVLRDSLRNIQVNKNLDVVNGGGSRSNLGLIVESLPHTHNNLSTMSSLREILDGVKAPDGEKITIIQDGKSVDVPPKFEYENISVDNSSSSQGQSSQIDDEEEDSRTASSQPQSGLDANIAKTVKSTSFTIPISTNSSGALNDLLLRFEKSIRTFRIESYKFDISKDQSRSVTISGRAFYQPEYEMKLKTKKVYADDSRKNQIGNSSSNISTGGRK